MTTIMSTAKLGFPFECESPFLFAVYHLDRFPAGTSEMGVEKSLLRGHRIGADFGNPAGWNMYHGEDGIPGFPKHPHRGFETITVTKQGLVDHTDSLGNGGRFGYGDVQWMTAGQGISHAEMFPLLNRSGPNVLELFQIWINLPRERKMAEPSFKMLWSEDVPCKAIGEAGPAGNAGVAEVTLVAGALPGFSKPPEPPPDSYASARSPNNDVLVAIVKLSAGSSWSLPAYSGTAVGGLNRNLYFFSGDAVTICGKRLTTHTKVKVRPDAEALIVADSTSAADVLVLQGRDIGEPVVQHGPFVGNTREDIMKAFSDYQATGFGRWPWESESLAFPPDRPRFAKYADGTLVEKPMPSEAR